MLAVVLQLRGGVGAQEQVLRLKNCFLQPPLLLPSHRKRAELEVAGCRPGARRHVVWSGPRTAGQRSGQLCPERWRQQSRLGEGMASSHLGRRNQGSRGEADR